MHLSRREARDERGVVAILVALSLVVLGMGAAMAVDLGNMAQLHRHGQFSVDNAALSGADLLQQGTDSLDQIVVATEGYMQENWKQLSSASWNTCSSAPSGFSAPVDSNQNCVTFNGTSTASATAINVQLPPQPVPFGLARLGGFMSGSVDASATAVVEPGIAPCALCVLGPSGTTLSLNGSGSFTVTDSSGSGNAGIAVDSNGTPAAEVIGSSGTITAPSIGVVGTYQGSSGTFQPTPTTGINTVPDPLGSLKAPTPANTTIPSASYTCNTNCGILPADTYGNITVGAGGNLTIPAGNYSGISVSGSSTLTLENGPYFITGPFTVGGTGGANVQESAGVMLYFTCSSDGQVTPCTSGESGGSLNLSGTGDISLNPQTTGTDAGVTIFYDRNNTAPLTLEGTPGMSISGTIYAKSSTLNLSGTGTTLGSLIVVNSAAISGNGSIGINYDANQNVRPPGTPYLCSTTANNC